MSSSSSNYILPPAPISTSNEDNLCKLLCAVLILEKELKDLEGKSKDVYITREQCLALIKEYQDGLKDVSAQLDRLLVLVTYASSPYLSSDRYADEGNNRFRLCLYSLAELELCLEKGAEYILSFSVTDIHQPLLKLNPLAGGSENRRTFSLTSSYLLRDFLFFLDVVLVRIQHISETIVNSEVRMPYPNFKWRAESCRLAVGERFRREQRLLLHASSAEQLATKDSLHLRGELATSKSTGSSQWKSQAVKQAVASYLMQLLEGPTSPDSLSSKFKIKYKDLKEGTYLGSGSSGYVVACDVTLNPF